MNEKQKRFCHEYIIDLNATQAALRAGYSKKTARTQAAKLLTKGNIQTFVAGLQRDIEKTSNITAQKVLLELAKIAFSDISDYLDIKGNEVTLKDFSLLTKNQTAAIESIQQTKDGIRFKLYNKPQTLELIGKHLGMFIDQQKQPEEIDIPLDIDNLDTDKVNEYFNRLRLQAN